jgi:hypothetical protein
MTARGSRKATSRTSEETVRNVTWAVAALALVVVMFPAGVAGDWGKEAARRVVGRVAREAIEEALEDSAVDVVLDEVVENAVGAAAREGIETAMEVAEVADTLDDVMDAAETINTIRKIGKIVR